MNFAVRSVWRWCVMQTGTPGALARMVAMRFVGCVGSIGMNAPPALSAPAWPRRDPLSGRDTTGTIVSGPTPMLCSRWASASARRSSSAYVISRSSYDTATAVGLRRAVSATISCRHSGAS